MADQRFVTNVQLGQNELRNAVVQPLPSPPAGPHKTGRLYYDTTLGMERVWDGTRWTPAIRHWLNRPNGEATQIVAGTPLYINGANAWRRAANTSSEFRVVALALHDMPVGTSGDGQTGGILTLDIVQWDIITGQVGGLSAARYFLTAASGLTTAPDVTTTGRYVCPIGQALSPTQLELRFTPTTRL